MLQRRRGQVDAAQQFGDSADLGLRAGGHHHAAAAAAGDGGAAVAHVAAITHRQSGLFQYGGIFLHGAGFTREQGLVDLQLLGLQQAQVSGDDGAGLQHGNIAGYQFAGRYGPVAALPQHPGAGRRQLAQGGNGGFRAILLDHPYDRVQADDHQDGNGIRGFADEGRDQGRRQQDLDHQVAELGQHQGG